MKDGAGGERFPRSAELPSQSPLFWVQQKDRYLRQLLIRDIEQLTNRRLIVYFADRFQNASIDQRDCLFFAELLRDVRPNDPVDLMLETAGGQTDATEGLVSLVQNSITDLRVVVPNAAKSNGTLLCMAAHTIVMGPTSELGPIEPAIEGIPVSILVQPQIAQTNYPLHMFGQFALKQTRALAERLLTAGMMKSCPDRIKDTVDALSSRDRYSSHGSAIDHKEAVALGLHDLALPADDELWQRFWLLHCMYQHDCERARYSKLFEGRALSTAVAVPVVHQVSSALAT